jgi:molecular chaperone IbpA
VQVRDAQMADGLLVIDLVRELPKALRPRPIEIANSNEPQALEQVQAA